MPWATTRRRRRWRWSGRPTRCSARSAWPSWCRRRGRRRCRRRCWPTCGNAARASLADYKAPDRVVVVDRLPLTSMMKVDKRALADRAARAWTRTEHTQRAMTGNSTPAQGGVTDDPIRIGTMLYTLVEPHRGHEVAYNRWYERDHFYAGCQIGAYNFAGGRFVATAPLKGLRYPDGRRRPGGRPGSRQLPRLYYVLDGHHDEWNRWAVDQVNALHAAGRMFDQRDHIHTGLYHFEWEHRPRRGRRAGRADPGPPVRRDGLGVPRAGGRHHRPEQIGPGTATGTCPVCCPARRWPRCWPSARCPCWPTPPATCPAARRWTSGCCCSSSSTRTRRRVGRGLRPAGRGGGRGRLGRVLWVSPFIGTVPGTDTYTDQLWPSPATTRPTE